MFVCRQYLFREAKTVSYKEQIMSKDKIISKHIFAPNGGYCLYNPSNLFRTKRAVLNMGEYSQIFPSSSWGIFSHMMHFDQLHASKKIWWIIMHDRYFVVLSLVITDSTCTFNVNQVVLILKPGGIYQLFRATMAKIVSYQKILMVIILVTFWNQLLWPHRDFTCSSQADHARQKLN